MPVKAHQSTRREMNRLVRAISAHAGAHPPLEAMRSMIVHCADELNAAWADYRRARAKRTERGERALSRFVERWRPVAILLVPGASDRLGELPPRGGRSLVAYAKEILALIRAEPGEERLADVIEAELAVSAPSSAEEALSDAMDAARLALSEAAQRANIVLLHGLDALRACVGEDSEVFREFAVDIPWDQDVLGARPREGGACEGVGR